MLRALWNIFDALKAPREDLSESVPPAPGISTPAAPALANGTLLWALPLLQYQLQKRTNKSQYDTLQQQHLREPSIQAMKGQCLHAWRTLEQLQYMGQVHAGGSEAQQARHPKASWAVSPSELREALSGLGKAAIKFELSEMHDAAEVSGLHAQASGLLELGEQSS